MSGYVLVLAGFGALVLLTAWLPMVLRELPLSLPILCVGIGAAVFGLVDLSGLAPHPNEHLALTERLTEAVVLIALMGAGLKIDRPFELKAWNKTWRLLGIAMPLTILALVLLGQALLGLGLASALLLAAALAPTDPVLASDVQVGPPMQGQEDDTRFALTSEAGLNDGLAFPFVHLALLVAAAGGTLDGVLGGWLLGPVLWKTAAGVGAGAALGTGLGWLVFHMPNRSKLSRTGDGFVALGVTCLVYGLTEMIGGYGFLAVFVAALALRAAERNHSYHEKLHDFADQLERLLMMVLLVAFGGALAAGGLFGALTPGGIVFALAAIFVVRPLAGWVALLGTSCPRSERAVVAFFGIRGIGTLYYLAYGLNHGSFPGAETLWSVAGLTITISILLHGTTVTPVMRAIDRATGRERPEDAQFALDLPAGVPPPSAAPALR